ncbi:J domain-containing protein [Pseudoduganella chitinolytica]|uniref:J domain-containing protein n=1 Tax=Pseudoduganella chitinolytica TaxID=34070 RepID=A0ABY8BDI6_9BURK|nr:J domain-containing protein [Pseudoduganella chitinolytica]WEF32409.1 J domain-containing protein [Pseudoduganella chitinolytica]
MGKIHTHYDNLKVARGAPQEVIRAAYKALSQKYHPDKNPGDEKAARIMAIVNTAYGTLADPQRRKEHDDWIAQEEFEVEWLESTHEERSVDAPAQAWSEQPEGRRRRVALTRNWRWWLSIAGSLALGWVAGVMTVAEPRQVSTVLASAWGGSEGSLTASAGRPAARGERMAEAEGWGTPAARASAEGDGADTAPIKVLAVSQVVLPEAGAECDNETPALVAPNGEPWPTRSGYVTGFPVANKGQDMELTLDNTNNALPVFIKVYDLERRANVRYVFVQAHDRHIVDELATGHYEIRYQNIDLAGKSDCSRRQGG